MIERDQGADEHERREVAESQPRSSERRVGQENGSASESIAMRG